MIRILQILQIILLLINVDLLAQDTKEEYSESSVLSSGRWFKISVTEDGVYRIDYSLLVQLGLEYPSTPRIYCNNYGQLSYNNNDPRPDDLRESAILTVTGSDGIFNEGDYLLFYGKGTNRWIYDESTGNYDFLRHNYSDTAFYFITSDAGQGKRITFDEEPAGPVNYTSSESDALYIHELESENLIKSGREWYQPVTAASTIQVNPGFTGIVISEGIRYSLRVLTRASVQTMLSLYEGEIIHEAVMMPEVDLSSTTGTYARIDTASGTFIPSSSSPVFEIKYFNNGESGAKAWIDYIKLQGRKTSSYDGNTLHISDSKSIGSGSITEFNIMSTEQDVTVWDITDPFNIKIIPFTFTAGKIKFKAATDLLKTFIVFTSEKAILPGINSRLLENQDLHASEPAEMIIVTHPLFNYHAGKLADIHFSNSGLTSLIVTPEQIYNEFSGGIPDISAIRNFIRMKYLKQKGTVSPLKYLLLFGDGSFENRTPPPYNPNFIPTYQSKNSNVVISSFTSDDFYGLLEDGEGEDYGTEDIGIGRLPVSDTTQAGVLVSKIARYLDPSNEGDWKNVICLVADDEDGNTHMSDAEGLAALIGNKYPSFNVDKIYLDAYQQVTSATGQSYPDVNKAINDRMNSGCLIFNFVGHGNELGLAHERVLKPEDIRSWKNKNKLPLFITATCEFSRFDDTEYNIVTGIRSGINSSGESVLLRENGGGIALLSTTRVVYSAPNYFLNRNIYDIAFEYDSSGNALRLGDVIRIAKNNSGDGPNKRNFLLLGDPALRIAFPWHGKVITDSINNIPSSGTIDSLKALSLVTVSGHIEDSQGNTADSFNGMINSVIFDKETLKRTLANDGGSPMEFGIRNNILFSGKTIVNEGRFRFNFIVPRDIDYSYGTGKISYYASNNNIDMHGSFTDIIIGGFSDPSNTDTSGPAIRLFLNDTLFRNGGITDSDPRLLAIIEDSSGINTTGSGIGHDLACYLDGERNNPFALNSYFENDFGSYTRGSVIYPLSGLDQGPHSITVKAWDNFNNSSEESIMFMVENSEGFVLKDLLNYPNPFFHETKITAEHNRPDEKLVVTISIYNSAGKLIRILNKTVISTGYQLPPFIWDGNDAGGKRAGRGIYFYRVAAATISGDKAVISGRMIIL